MDKGPDNTIGECIVQKGEDKRTWRRLDETGRKKGTKEGGKEVGRVLSGSFCPYYL